MTALATVDRVAARADVTISTPQEIALANEMLEAASALVRFYGDQPWLDPATAPAVAVVITVAAAARGYLNPSGYSQERGDSVTLLRNDAAAEGVQLTPQEVAMLRPYRRRGGGGIQSVSLENAHSPIPESRHNNWWWRGYAQIGAGVEKPFPLGSDYVAFVDEYIPIPVGDYLVYPA